MPKWCEWFANGLSRATSETHSPLARVCAGVLVVALAACVPRGEPDPGAAYLERLGGVLDTALIPPPGPRGPPWPSRRALTLPIVALEIDAVEFVALHGCDLGALAGYRNSPLGRVQRASQRLGYEAEWLRIVGRCANAPVWLEGLAREKRAALPALFWNATLGSEEFRIAAGASLPGDAAAFAHQLERLRAHHAALLRDAFDVDAFEVDLGRLARESAIGTARARWLAQRAVLDTARQALLAEAPRLCRNGRPTPRARYLTNVFARFYVLGLQPALAREHARDGAWIDVLLALTDDQSGVTPPVYRDWVRAVLDPAQPSSEWARTRAAVVAHAEVWQALFARCGIDPRSIAQDPAAAGTISAL
ncbi:MAG: hypothetical protein RL756_1535 [Pseudomonadota bacterium]